MSAEYDGGDGLIARYEHGFGLLARTNAAGNPAYYTFSAIGHTTVPTNAPVLAWIANQTINVGEPLAITNVLVSGTPVGSFIFNLGYPAPAGASINPSNGMFRWTPNCSQASRTNVITVWVTDSGNTNLLDAVTFQVVVGECVQPQWGRIVMQTCETNQVPLFLLSTVPLTNVEMTLEVLGGRLENLSLETLLPEICTATIEAGVPRTPPLSPSGGEGGRDGLPGRPPESGGSSESARLAVAPYLAAAGPAVRPYLLRFATCTNQFLMGTQHLAWLHFTAVCTQSSAFVNLEIPETVGTQPDGTPARNFAPVAGRVVIIGEEPLLEAVMGTNRQPELILYGQVGTTNVVEANPNLDNASGWQPRCQVTLTNLFQTFACEGVTNRTMFYRARRE